MHEKVCAKVSDIRLRSALVFPEDSNTYLSVGAWLRRLSVYSLVSSTVHFEQNVGLSLVFCVPSRTFLQTFISIVFQNFYLCFVYNYSHHK